MAWVRLSLAGTESRVVGEAESAAGIRALLERRRPSLLVIDYRLPEMRATDVVRSLQHEGWSTPVLVITAKAEVGLNERVLEAGAQGVVVKRGDADELLTALRRVVAGESVLDPDHPRRPPGEASLSPRERDVLSLAAAELTNPRSRGSSGSGPSR